MKTYELYISYQNDNCEVSYEELIFNTQADAMVAFTQQIEYEKGCISKYSGINNISFDVWCYTHESDEPYHLGERESIAEAWL